MATTKMNDLGDYILMKTYTGISDDRNKDRTESMCLEGEQTYQFTIYDSYGDGLTASGHYNVTSNRNRLIVEGGEFGLGEITSFSIPFISGSAISSVITQAPTISPSPTIRVTPFPTDPESSPKESSVSTTAPSPPSVSSGDNVSSPPVASPDSTSVSVGDEVFVSVLDNDTPSAGETLEVNNITTQASNGTCSIGLDFDEVIYEPNPGFTGFDTCVYEACDSVPACDTAMLTIVVVGT